jgi:hypothetical protein
VGVADVAMRTKYWFTPDGPGHASAALELRLPTGREEDLLGTGAVAMRFSGIGSAEAGRASVHGNVVVGTGGLGRELSLSGAAAFAATPQLTVVGEVLSRRVAGARRITEISAPHPRIAGVDTLRLLPASGDDRSTMAVAGLKWNLAGTWLIQANVLMPLTDAGLTARYTPMIAVDYSFTR